MFMPYIEGPKMNWTVDDGLYHRFLKWHLKCKTILDCELANLPAKQKCQKVIAWSGDFGMDLYVSWSIPKEELMLDAIWTGQVTLGWISMYPGAYLKKSSH